MALSARSARVATASSSSRVSLVAPSSRVRSVVVKASDAPAAPAAPKAEKAPWSEPKLNPDTPSPIFGGSTGGLLRKAQVRGAAVRGGGHSGRGKDLTQLL
jgi:hypothetical protein